MCSRQFVATIKLMYTFLTLCWHFKHQQLLKIVTTVSNYHRLAAAGDKKRNYTATNWDKIWGNYE